MVILDVLLFKYALFCIDFHLKSCS